MVLTVTMYYSNSVINPIIYFCLNPKTKRVIKTMMDRELSWERSTKVFSSLSSRLPSPLPSPEQDVNIVSFTGTR